MTKKKIEKYIFDLLSLDVGYSIKVGLLMIRSLDNGDFAVSYDLENPASCWEEEFDSSKLTLSVNYFLQKKDELDDSGLGF